MTNVDAPIAAVTDVGYIQVSPANIVRSIRYDIDGTLHLNPDSPDPVVFPDQVSADAGLAPGHLVQKVSIALPQGGYFQATVSDATSATVAAFTTYAGAYEFVDFHGSDVQGAITVMEPESSPVCASGPNGEDIILGHAVVWVQKPFTRCLTFTRDAAS